MRNLAWLTCTTLVALTLGACGDDGGSDDNNTTNDPSSSSGPTTNDPTVTTSMSTTVTTVSTDDPSSSSDPTDATSSGSGSTGPDPDSSGSESGSESGTGGDVCVADAEDDECTTCTKGSCCDELTACYADTDCQCVVLCSQAVIAKNPGTTPTEAAGICTTPSKGGDPAECTFPSDPTLVINLSQCVTGMCGGECGGPK